MRGILPPPIDYRHKTYEDLLDRLLELAQGAGFPWNDFFEGNIGTAHLELFAHVGDALIFYRDRLLQESALFTARELVNIREHLRKIGYDMARATSATTALTFTLLAGAHGQNVTVPKGMAVLTADGRVRYETVAPLVIAAGETSGQVQATEGRTREEALGISDGTPTQRFAFPGDKFLWASEKITIGDNTWTRRDDFLESDGGSEHYLVDTALDGTASVVFGDGAAGKVPTNQAVVTAVYRVGGGKLGRVDAGQLVRIDGVILDATAAPMQVGVTNENRSIGGADEESVWRARLSAVRNLAANRRSASNPDYVTHAQRVDGVLRAQAVTRNEKPGLPENVVLVSVLADQYDEGGAPADPTIPMRVEEYLRHGDRPSMNTTMIWCCFAQRVVIPTAVSIYYAQGYDPGVIEQKAAAAIDALFDLEAIDEDTGEYVVGFGDDFYISLVHWALQGIPGVRHVTVQAPGADVDVTPDAIRVKGDVAIVMLKAA